MSTFTVLIPDDVDPRALDILNAAEGLTVIAPGKLTQEQLLAAVPGVNGMLIRSGVKITADILAAATDLKVIARAGVGVDNVDLPAATAHGVVVVNTPGGNTISTAEHTFGLMLALARFLPQGDASLRAGKWDRKSFTGVELRGKTLGLIGCGRIGQAIAVRAQAFGMTVIGFDPYLPDAAFAAAGISKVDLATLYAQSDFISLHTLLNNETRGLINADAIAQMKDGVRILNAARGALINDADLAAALKSGKVAGAGLDVFEPEPPAADNPLIGLPNVVHTPHLAASTSDAQITVALEAAELVRDFLLKGDIQNVCNPAVLDKKSS